jgi:putative protease
VPPELLLPAGDPEKLRYAIAYGADAVYLGLPMASLRTPSRGEPFTPQNLGEHLTYCHDRGVKAYVTVNIFPSNRDIKRVIPHLEQLADLKPDALIVSDPGVIGLAQQYAPNVPLHLSTQANTLNWAACAFWQQQGIERIILAREVPVADMAEIHERLPDLELECFVHGSICVAYSGRCVISDYLTDNTKNSNKGMCGNSCRWEFEPVQMREKTRPNEVYTFEEDDKGTYMLNSRDLCLIGRLRELQDAGIVSFKVEGRTKSVYYVATVGRAYRQAIEYFQTQTECPEDQLTRWVQELSMAGNRGFTEGFFSGRPDHSAYNYQDSHSHQQAQFLAVVSEVDANRVRLIARNPLRVGDSVEWLSPQSEPVAMNLTALESDDGLPLQALQTNQTGWVTLPETVPASAWGLLRRPLKVIAHVG